MRSEFLQPIHGSTQFSLGRPIRADQSTASMPSTAFAILKLPCPPQTSTHGSGQLFSTDSDQMLSIVVHRPDLATTASHSGSSPNYSSCIVSSMSTIVTHEQGRTHIRRWGGPWQPQRIVRPFYFFIFFSKKKKKYNYSIIAPTKFENSPPTNFLFSLLY